MLKKKSLFTVVILVVVSVIGIFSYRFTNFHSVSAVKSPCEENLRIIDACKQGWALDNGKTTNDTPNWVDLHTYFTNWTKAGLYMKNGLPFCPEGGIYTIGKVGELPTCSVGGPGHSLSE
jgi:hypothetical protein